MTGKARTTTDRMATNVASDQSRAVRIIAVGELTEWKLNGNTLPNDEIAFMNFEDVTEETLNYLQPSTVYSPILAKTFDCIELAIRLNSMGFAGEYRAMASNLPNPSLIEREVRQLCPQLDFAITASV